MEKQGQEATGIYANTVERYTCQYKKKIRMGKKLRIVR